MSVEQKIIGTAVLFIIIIGSGIWLSYAGKPYNTSIFTVHKLIALAAVLFTVFLLRNLLADIETGTFVIALLVTAALSVLALFVTGALLSIGKVPYLFVKILHIVAPVLAAGSTAAAIYILLSKH